MAQVVYARVRDEIKDAVDTYAARRESSLAGAVDDLLERGLRAAASAGTVEELSTELGHVRSELVQTSAALRQREGELANLSNFTIRARATKVGECPNPTCRSAVSGFDLLAIGQCAQCSAPLLGLLAPPVPTKTAFDDREFALVLGALGLVLAGVAALGKGA